MREVIFTVGLLVGLGVVIYILKKLFRNWDTATKIGFAFGLGISTIGIWVLYFILFKD